MDLLQLHTAFVVLMPIIVAVTAGAIRQDGFPQPVNETITLIAILFLSILQSFLDGKLGGSPLADFAVVSAYTTAMMHTPLFQQLQSAVQTHVIPVASAATLQAPVAPAIDIPALAGQVAAQMDLRQLAANLKQELMNDPRIPPPQQIDQMATKPELAVQPPNRAG